MGGDQCIRLELDFFEADIAGLAVRDLPFLPEVFDERLVTALGRLTVLLHRAKVELELQPGFGIEIALETGPGDEVARAIEEAAFGG